MNWFEEQLKQRQTADNENFADALDSIAGAVMGKRLTDALDAQEIAQSAIDEILKFYHCKLKNDELPPQVKTLEEQLDYRMRPLGIMRRSVRLDKDWYHCAVGAMLGTLKADGRAVALIPGKISGYSYIDLATGKRVRITRRNRDLLDEEAMCFYQPLPMRALTIRDLLLFMVQQMSLSDIVLYLGLMAVMTLLGMLSPKFTSWLFGDVLKSGNTTVLFALAGFMFSYSVSRMLMNAFQSLANARLGIKQNIAVQAAVMSRMISLPVSFFKEYSSGELSQRSMYVQSLCTTMMNTVGTVGLSSVFSLVYLGQIFQYAKELVLPSILLTLSNILIGNLTAMIQMRVSKERMQRASKTSGLTYSTITGIQKIKLAGAEKRMFARWARSYAKDATLSYNPPVFLRLSSTLSLAVAAVGTLVLYYFAVTSGISVSDYYAFNAAYGMVSGAFTSLVSVATTIAGIRPTLDMAKPIMEAVPETNDAGQVVTQLRGAIELNNISFRYRDDMPNVIDDLSLKIRAGEYLAIVGATGCGKSTLLRLLLGFEKPQKGSIYYDRKDMSRLDLQSLRRHIGTVMQDGKLFYGDIFSNIVISAPQLTLREAWQAAEIAAIADDIRAMPMGMNTMISEGQGGISGGQKQRLMIARAIAPNPRVLMFDEATSALDNLTQKKVSDAINTLKCTRIVIAHRLSTIRHADRIIFLKDGKIVEDGTYEELIAKNGYFAELVERQRLDVDVD